MISKLILITVTTLSLATASHHLKKEESFDLYERGEIKESENRDWPPVNFPYNFKINYKVYTWNAEKKELESYKNTSALQYVDSDGNRELTMFRALPKEMSEKVLNDEETIVGDQYQHASVYLNCTTGVVTFMMPELDYCRYIPTGKPFNLKKMIDDIMDPKAGITEYKGISKLPYSATDLH